MATSPYTTQSIHTSQRRRQVDELITLMSPTAVPFLKLVGINGTPGNEPKFEWMEDVLLAETTLVTDNPLTNVATTLNVTATEGICISKCQLLRLEDEIVYVNTDPTADAIPIVRGVGGTSAAQHALGTVVHILGSANLEENDTPKSSINEASFPYNYFQAFDTSYTVSYIQANTEIYGYPQGTDAEVFEKKLKKIMVELEKTCFLGTRQDQATVGGVVIPRLMGGMDYYLSSAYGTNHYTAALGTKNVTEKNLYDMFQNVYHKVGQDNMGTTLICNSWNKRVIDDLFREHREMPREERTGGVMVDVLDTDFGQIDIVMTLRCPEDKIYLVNLDFISIHPYDGLAFFDEEKASSGAYTKRQIYGVYTMMVKNTRSMGVLTGTTTS